MPDSLKRHGIEPAPRRIGRQPGKSFWLGIGNRLWLPISSPLKLDPERTEALYRFVFDRLSTRKIEIAGIARSADGLWMSRRVTDAIDGILNGRRYLIHDRDPLFTLDFQRMLASVGVQVGEAASAR